MIGTVAYLAKAFFLGYCVRKLLRVYIGEMAPDDIDDYTNKRCCAAGLQFALLILGANCTTTELALFARNKGQCVALNASA